MESNVMNKVWEAYTVLLQWEADEMAGVAGTTDKPEAKSACEALFEARMLLQEALYNLRNCDAGTAEEQAERHTRFCLGQRWGCRRCPVHHKEHNACVLAWAQLPYQQEGDK